MENQIQELLHEILTKLQCSFNKIRVENKNDTCRINIETNEPNLMIGHHGENINALQHLLKLILWKRYPEQETDINLDIDNYKKRQEDNVIKIAEKKVDLVRKLSSPQDLPAMSPYFRRIVHTHLATENYGDIRTESYGEGEQRYIVIKPQLII